MVGIVANRENSRCQPRFGGDVEKGIEIALGLHQHESQFEGIRDCSCRYAAYFVEFARNTINISNTRRLRNGYMIWTNSNYRSVCLVKLLVDNELFASRRCPDTVEWCELGQQRTGDAPKVSTSDPC